MEMISFFENKIKRKARNAYIRELLDELMAKRDHATRVYYLYKMKEDDSITTDEFKVLDDIIMGRCNSCSVRKNEYYRYKIL